MIYFTSKLTYDPKNNPLVAGSTKDRFGLFSVHKKVYGRASPETTSSKTSSNAALARAARPADCQPCIPSVGSRTATLAVCPSSNTTMLQER